MICTDARVPWRALTQECLGANAYRYTHIIPPNPKFVGIPGIENPVSAFGVVVGMVSPCIRMDPYARVDACAYVRAFLLA